MVVDPEVDEDVGEARVAAVSLHDEEGGRLLAAPVAARCLRRGEALDQALHEGQLRVRLERRRERSDRLPADEDVALCRVAGAGAVSRPVVALRPRPACAVAVSVDDSELALGPSVVGCGRAARRPRSRSARRAGARARPGRSADSRTPALRSLPPRAPPTGRPSPRRGTSTARRRPTDPPRGRRRRSSRSRRPGHAIRQLGQVELEQLASLLRHEHGRHLGPRQRRAHLLRRRGADDDGTAARERLGDRRQVLDVVEDERLLDRHHGVALDRELRHTPAATAPPALPHTVTESPGSISSTWKSGASSRS